MTLFTKALRTVPKHQDVRCSTSSLTITMETMIEFGNSTDKRAHLLFGYQRMITTVIHTMMITMTKTMTKTMTRTMIIPLGTKQARVLLYLPSWRSCAVRQRETLEVS